ncbi:MAG: LarC family nickel insertion protein, partial [Lachnospiraceae bacterium]|nr:LarC family nickel insertion protein [Lachnospiraceae bacterium]
MGKTLYLECNSGISGDMTVAALIDLGADSKVLTEALASLPIQGFETEISRVKKAGLDACDFNVKLDKAHENHDHDMEYLHGHTHDHGQAAAEDHAHIHSHE